MEGRKSQGERETKGRRTVEGEERIDSRGTAQARRDPALCEEQKERDRRREEERGKRGGGTGNAITFSCSGPCCSMGNAPSQGMSTLSPYILV